MPLPFKPYKEMTPDEFEEHIRLAEEHLPLANAEAEETWRKILAGEYVPPECAGLPTVELPIKVRSRPKWVHLLPKKGKARKHKKAEER
jgi:hypothetical protein